jgi:hypothetical protein
MIAKCVRLIFHDCVSGCNGCVNFNNADNKGLEQVVFRLNGLYKEALRIGLFYGNRLSLADLYVIAASRAVYLGSLHDGLTLPVVDFKFGRKDCTDPNQDNKEIFASAEGNWSTIFSFFETNFQYTKQDVVAILGAHNLGMTNATNSGYDGPWVTQWNARFDNQFYKNMINNTLNFTSTLIGAKSQWNSGLDTCLGPSTRPPCHPARWPRMMLNSDMCLYKEFNPDPITGKADCPFKTCKSNLETAALVETYASNEPLFKEHFSIAFQKMIEKATGTLTDVQNPYNTSQNTFATINNLLKYTESAPLKEQFKFYHYLLKKAYPLNSEEALKRYKIFKSNVKMIKEQNSMMTVAKYGFNAYTDQTNEEYVKAKTGVEGSFIDFDKFADLEIDQYSHISLDA